MMIKLAIKLAAKAAKHEKVQAAARKGAEMAVAEGRKAWEARKERRMEMETVEVEDELSPW